ncbi:TGS domain-containing protein [Thermoanaerobacterium thermosaccharolyticum]|uniref:TGS domain-containing protein n=1 Tax=Thermoanaerobacterium thermosaccharolyticum TaxID=1517 RepID=UPI001781AAEB|nr:nucleoside kinase [Thermoanaerobacterium thermosaccharolyticum]MBE0067514.1 nucleoside kinase [Thermoanaerobacterium thermosaccharolyticum]MBE0229337.1 nucleoside kinase [Thermoanaerobacterium thermosaccharolyticum]
MNLNIDGKTYFFSEGITLEDISQNFKDMHKAKIVAAKVNNEVVDLSTKIDKDCDIEFIDMSTEEGMKVYRRSLTFVLIKAVKDILPGSKVTIEHSLGKGLYCEIHGSTVNNKIVQTIKNRMKEIIDANYPIVKKYMDKKAALDLFMKEGLEEKVSLFKYSDRDEIPVYYCDDVVDFFYSPCVPSTGYLKLFDLLLYFPGVILLFPEPVKPDVLPTFVDVPKLASIFKEAEEWANILNICYVSFLNDMIKNGHGRELVLISEALHEKKIASIADHIYQNKMIKLVLIAGPSSSGKTSFVHRLSVQLRVNGLKPLPISLDNYFLPRDKTPKDEFGNYNFETIDALDLELFNDQIIKLMQGEEVELPIFNFKKGVREEKGQIVQLEKNQIILVEGIHGLNERLTRDIPKDSKYRVYISALTQLNLDEHNRISTTETRLLRRIVRDNQFRSSDAEETILMWPSVRKGEENYIFPYQEDADIMFNSSLPYELPVIKRYAEPLLKDIDSDSKAFSVAQELLEVLSYFVPLEDESAIPPNSLIKEFIGGSCLDV